MNEKPEQNHIQLENLEARETRTLRRITGCGILDDFINTFNSEHRGLRNTERTNPGDLYHNSTGGS